MRFKVILLVLIVGCILSCNTVHNSAGVEKAMKNYDQLIQRMDAQSISMLFTPDGHLGDMASGRDSIRIFLSSFKNVQVLTQNSTSDSIKMLEDTAFQNGTYHQTDVINGKDTLHVQGTYSATWIWVKGNGWMLKKISTQSL